MTQDKPTVPVVLGIDQPRLTINALHAEGAVMISILIEALNKTDNASLKLWAARIRNGLTASYAYQGVIQSIFADFSDISEVSLHSHQDIMEEDDVTDDATDDSDSNSDDDDQGGGEQWH
jgi:hypothetical protein